MAEKKEGKMVTIRLFRDSNKYADDMIVGVDGKFYKVKRGVDVEVPEAVAMVIEESLRRKDELDELLIRTKKAPSAN